MKQRLLRALLLSLLLLPAAIASAQVTASNKFQTDVLNAQIPLVTMPSDGAAIKATAQVQGTLTCTTYPVVTIYDTRTAVNLDLVDFTNIIEGSGWVQQPNFIPLKSGDVVFAKITTAGVGCTGDVPLTINLIYMPAAGLCAANPSACVDVTGVLAGANGLSSSNYTASFTLNQIGFLGGTPATPGNTDAGVCESLGVTPGDICYYNGTNWTILPGNQGDRLYLSESSGVPSYQPAGGGAPAGGLYDIQINDPLNSFGADPGIAQAIPSSHTLTDNILQAFQQVGVSDATHSGLICQGHSNGTIVDSAFCTQPSSTFSTANLGYVLFPPDGAPTVVGQAINVSSLTTTPVVTQYGTLPGYPTVWGAALGAVSAENVTPTLQSNSPSPATTSDIVYTPYTQAQNVSWRGPIPNTFGQSYPGQPVAFQDNTGSLTTCSVSLSSTAAGNTIFVMSRSDLFNFSSVTDSQGNTPTTLFGVGGTFFGYFKNIKGGNDTVTLHYAGATGCMIYAFEEIGADPTSPIMVDGGSASGCTGSAPTFNAVSLTAPGTVLGLMIGHGVPNAGNSIYIGTGGYGIPLQIAHYGGGGLGESRSEAVAWQAFGSTGSETPSATATNCGTDSYTVAIRTASSGSAQQPTWRLDQFTDLYNALPYGTDIGAADAYVTAFNSCPPSLIPGISYTSFLPANANATTTPTLNWCSLGAQTITKNGQSALAANDLITTKIATLVWDGTDWELQNPANGSGASVAFSAITSATNTTATMTCGAGCTITTTSTGVNNANQVNGAVVPTSAPLLASNSSKQIVAAGAQYTKSSCQTGLGDGANAITAGTYLQSFCYNDSGSTWTLTGLRCLTDNNGTSTLSATNGAGTALLTGAVTCTTAWAAGTQGTTVTIASGDYIKFTFIADGTSKQSSWEVAITK